MPTLILPPRMTDDSVKLWRAAIAANWQTHRLLKWEAPEDIPPAEVVVYGGFFIALADKLGVTLLSPDVDFLAKLPIEFTGRRVRFMSLADARKVTDRAFYKPSDDKCFITKVYDGGHELPPVGQLPDDVPVLISDIVHWDIEFRCFILDGQVVTLSPYLRNHERIDTPDGQFPATVDEFAQARNFAQRIATAVPLPPGVVLDVGYIRNHGWAVIEANQAWGAGIYGCDPAAVLPILRRVCIPIVR